MARSSWVSNVRAIVLMLALSIKVQTMKTICLNKLSLKSYMTLCTMISGCLGFAMSVVLVFLEYAFGLDASIHLGGLYVNGHLLGVVSIFIGPFLAAAIGFVGSVLTHPIFRLILSWFSGLSLTGTWLEPKEPR